MTDITVDLVGVLPLRRQLELLAMGPNRRRRLLYRVAQRVMKDARARVRKQVDLQGRPYADRWKPRSDRRKMLSRLIKRMAVINNNGTQATIGFRGAGAIAAKQQLGHRETVTAAQNQAAAQRASGARHYDQPATKKQARALRDAGFKVKAGGRTARKATLSWITQNLTIGQAGFALRRLREWLGETSKTSWLTVLPARSFLGATDQEITAHINSIFEDMTQELQRGIR